jgi:hypothetical protein
MVKLPRAENNWERRSFRDGRKVFRNIRNTSELPQPYERLLCYKMASPSVVGLWGNRFPPVIAAKCVAQVLMGRLQVTKPDPGQTETRDLSANG